MKAMQFHRYGGSEVLEYVDVPKPSPGGVKLAVRRDPSAHLYFTSFASAATDMNARASPQIPKINLEFIPLYPSARCQASYPPLPLSINASVFLSGTPSHQ